MAQASAEELRQTRPAEKERMAFVSQRAVFASTPEPPFAKSKRNRAIYPDHQIVGWERVKVSESRILASQGNL